jgi:DNA mismatch repair protein MutS2
MGFDLETLEPTYRLTLGIPGSSFAVRISRRLGLPQTLIDRAVEVLEGEDHHSVDEVLATLEDQLQELHAERNRLEQARLHAEQQKRKFEKKYHALLDKERESIHAETRRLKEQLRQARDLIRDKIKELQQANVVDRSSRISQKELSEFQEELQGVEKTIEKAGERTRPAQVGPSGLAAVPADEIEEGMKVFVRSFNRVGTVIQYGERDSRALVQLGVLKATVEVDDLFYPSEAQRRSHAGGRADSGRRGGRAAGSKAAPATQEPTRDEELAIPQTADNTVDLRGLRVDEALEKLDLFLDHAYLSNRAGVHIIHGHGSGALKRAVRGHLVGSTYVDEFRPGDRHEGGDGVTVAAITQNATR